APRKRIGSVRLDRGDGAGRAASSRAPDALQVSAAGGTDVRVQVGDVRLFFDVDGAKLVPDGATRREQPTLLLLDRGPGLDHSQFKPWFGQVRDVAQVVYLEHRENGRSDRDTVGRCTLERWGDDVRAFCDALEIQQPIVLGVSFGGFVAQAYATRHP